MSTTVDERVVEMRFDNKQFEQNIQTSLSSLDKLKKSLNLEGAAKGLETVNDAANKCSGNMSPLSNAVETVRVRFSALEVMAITALQNITNSALAAGKNLVSAFTIDPIKTGFEEYETQINAVQTILANTSSKGTTLDQVNNALDELNHYADMTIYNFTEMTRNIGTFTAAGVDLDTSVAAIKGIANLAAVSGSNSQQASTAMYQLSQALAAGTVKLQDWNSVVNAGMGGQVFQDALKETAKVHGIAIDEMIKDEGSFRETLSKGWLTSDILTETLAKFTGDLNEDQLRTMGYTDDQIKSIMEMGKTANDAATKVKTFTQLFDTLKEAAQSGWTQSWEIIVGDFEEAKELLTEVSDTFSAVINASADARNKMLQDWKDLGGRTMMIEAVKNVFEGLVSVAKPVREAFNEIFPPMTGKQLAEITERIRDLTAKFKMGEESSKNLKNTFKGVFAVLDIVGQAFKAVAGGVGELIGLFLPAGNGVLSLTGISSDTGKVSKACTAMIAMSVAVSILAGALKKVSDLDWGELARGLVGIAGLTTIVVASSKAMASSQKQVMKGATSLIIFGAAIKILASACEDLSKLQWDELGRGLTGVGVLFAEIAVFLRVAKFNGKMISTATGIVILSAAMKVLASACKDFGQMEWSEIGKGLAGIGGLLAELAVFTNLAGNAKHVMSTGVALIAIGAAMKIFASAVKDFGQLQWDEIGRGLTAMGGALAEVAIAVNLMPKNMIGIGTGLVIVGGALEIIANCMSKFGGMQWEEIGRGLTVMGGALAELAISLNFMKGTLGGSAALLVASGALAVLAPVLSILGALSWEAIAKGLISIAGAFTIIGVAGAVLTPLVPTILALSGAFALIGVGVLTIGAGLLAAGTGLSALAIGFTALATAGAAGATAIVAALTVIVTGIAGLIPAVLTKVGEGIIAICKVIAAGAPAIGEAVKAVVLTLIDVFVSCVQQLADGALQLVVGVLAALVTYTPQIVDLAFKFLIGILDGIASNLPSLIKAGVDVLVAFFAGIVDALRGIDTGALLKGIAGIGLLSAIMLALSATASLVPGAMVGILGMGAIVAEMALVLAAVGLLSKLPGLSWLIGEGGKLLQGIGTAIGQFVGGIVGGFMSGVSSQFPQIGADLSTFMNNVQPFLQGASQIQPSMMDGVKALAETVLILTAADILQGLTSWLTGGSSLSKFGEELVPFGEAMRDFSLAIGNMDGEIVANAATAGKALAEMAATIPNTGGLVSFFAGENDMTAFGKQLVPFGEAMRQFGDAITGLDANAVTEAAIAGKAMAEMATTIPNSGGVVGFFAGENDMGEFGKQLVPFGEAMKAFGDAVRGLEADAIVNSATAGKALVELADTVPNTGGVVAFFTGNNDVDTFGEKLVPFGEAMKAYSEAIMGMDSAAITNSATAGKALVELANTIPNTGGLVSWFTGDNDLGSFGDSLVQFGSGIKSYSDSISGIDTGIMSSVITQVNRLVEMAKGMAELDTSGMSCFSTALIQLGNNGIDGFINAFTDASGRVTSAANKYPEFQNAGMQCMIKFIAGVKEKAEEVKTAFTGNLNASVTAIRDYHDQFKQAGTYLVEGFADGISENTYRAEAKARAMARAAAEAAEDELDEHSPSRVGYHIGDFFGLGFVNAIGTYAVKAYNASAEMADSAKTGLGNAIAKVKDMIDNGVDGQPTIRPILDLSDVEEKSHRLNTLFSRSQALTVSTGIAAARGRNLQNEDTNPNTGNSYNFTQNNYSPKALSRTEIYRQTKNQFSAMERMVET